MNESYTQDRSIQKREVVAEPRTGNASVTRCPSEECMGSSLYHSEIRGNGGGGHSPVGGESLLVAQAGGGSCTRRGELKLRRKEEDCGKRGQREGMGMSQPAEYLAFPKPQDHLT